MNQSFPRPDGGHTRAMFARRTAHAVRAGLAAALVSLTSLTAMLALPTPAHAEKADRDKPLNIEADNMSYDDLNQKNVFTGHVVATKGTIVIKADRVDVTQDPQGYQYATGTSTGNNLSYFRQKRDGLDEYIDGNAVRIDYDGKNDFTKLTTRATVRRLQGLTKVQDEVHGSVITYDGQKDFYTATAGKDVASPGNPTGRVRAMLAPRSGNAASLDGPPATLAPSNTLKGTPQQ
ncbi:lipopolysaccharide transport periplasmic protein LptA [Caballeronia sp. LP006]|uniref:lipopolysaccharide transport periplasmic protein LptA n=1 Tax=unclassified Caballeronia TaxID=2646786 RepID=UPI00285E52FD|nr:MULTISPECIES: lipopolysaccharide transport periplasmic protein LptA [unclassified Caballeronia]MDR5770436.1 lipopolysaccharide transport periplasmic protein LptA [Caballeronia sp. LZ002]MDR5830180.1 lipopolysaccharide transport periplasmic protein LptA [Caballeronia sp. LP006]MDR5845873.1 lipopolysaccharide transport periplasmic protein LptA [Caballeronia sp. LZ003]